MPYLKKLYSNYFSPQRNNTIFFIFYFLFITHIISAQVFSVVKLHCEYRENPICIDEINPQLSWIINDTRRGAYQTAYQVIISSTLQKATANQGDIWDSEKVNSDESAHVIYKGLPLKSARKYFWRVKVWDQAKKASLFSEIATFEMGLLSPSDWKADWIGKQEEAKSLKIPDGDWIWFPQPVPNGLMVFFKKNFTIPEIKNVSKAYIKSSVDNAYEISLNQIKIGSIREFQPTRGQRFFLYDITKNLRNNENQLVISAFHTRNEKQGGFIGTIYLEFTDGSIQSIFTDDTWQCNKNEKTGWNTELPISKWVKAKIVDQSGGKTWGSIISPYQPPRSQMLRKEFSLKKKVIDAKVFVSGLGGYYLYINGKKVGADFFAPGWTYYPKHTQYQVYNVTTLLKIGNNAIGGLLGNLWWSGDVGYRGIGQYSEGPLKMIMQMIINYDDGTNEIIVTDRSWKIKPSPIIFNSIYDGEIYDARQEVYGWSQAGLNDKDWQNTDLFVDNKRNLVAEELQPIQATSEVMPETVIEISPGKFIFDMGQNIVGYAKLKVQGPAGTKITMRFAEIINPDGSIKTDPLRSAKATDEYILNGKNTEIWEPKFTYHGFQYVEVSGYPGRPTKEAITGIVVHTNALQKGQFACSNTLINKIHSNILWGLRGNMMSVVTDCPQRDERMGWTGDSEIFATTASYNRDMTLMYSKYLKDVTDCQREDGDVLNVNPNAFNEGVAQAGWADAIVILPWKIYQFTGDKRILENNYAAMVKWHKKKQSESKGFLREVSGFGDWVAVVPTSSEPIGSAYYFYTTKLLSQIAALIGKVDDAKTYNILADKIGQAFNEKHFDKETDNYGIGTQTSNLLPLAFGITSKSVADNVAKNIADDVNKRNIHLSTGFLGTQYILPILSDHGYHDLSYSLATQWTYPSWGYMVEKGATTIWELWNSDKQGPEMNSRNHYSYGTIGQWFYTHLGGIEIDDLNPGFKNTIIHPRPVGNLTWAIARVETIHGYVSSQWEKKENILQLTVTIPPNATGKVILPGNKIANIKEANIPIEKVNGVKNVLVKDNTVTFDIASGKYVFIINL